MVNTMNWVELTAKIVAAARVSFSDLIEQRKAENFYAFILYTDADCYTVVPAANSIERHLEKISLEDDNDPEQIAAYKWASGEWAYEAWKAEAFNEICRDLSAASQAACEAGSFAEFRQQVHSSMIKALEALDGEGFFGPIRNEIVIFISSSDYDEAIEMEDRSAQMLNSPKVYDQFLKRWMTP